tara:strand:- start:24 stop:833 length:810 start_codon:yes stop_codon:yes gene_type:complete
MQGNKPRKKKDPWDPLKHLDDNRTKWEKGLTGLGEALSADQEEESTLSSVATIVDAAATIKRTFDNNKKLGEETKDVKIEDVAKEFNAYQDLDPFVDFANRTDDASQNFFKQVQNLKPEDPKHKLIAKIVGTNKLNSRGSREENTQYKQMLEKANKPIEDPKKEAEKLKSPMHSYDGPGSADFEAEREFRTGVKPKTQHKIETWRDLEDEQLPTPETSKPTEKVEGKVDAPVEGLTETVIEAGTNSTANRLQDILNNRKPLTSLFGNMR